MSTHTIELTGSEAMALEHLLGRPVRPMLQPPEHTDDCWPAVKQAILRRWVSIQEFCRTTGFAYSELRLAINRPDLRPRIINTLRANGLLK